MANVPTPAQACDLWKQKDAQFSGSRAAIAEARRWLNREVAPTLPPEWQGPQDIALTLPQPTTLPLHTLQVMGRKRPAYRRIPIGTGMSQRERSSKIEEYDDALLTALEHQGGPIWTVLADALLNDGECAVLAYPQAVAWEQFPPFGDVCDCGAAEDEPCADSCASHTPQARYHRDSQGRRPDDAYYAESGKRRTFNRHAGKTTAAYDELMVDYKARHIPLMARVVTASMCRPLPGPNGRLKGLLIRSSMTVDDLEERGYTWIGGEGSPGQGQPEHTHTPSTFQQSCTVTELWLPGSVTYYVGDGAGSQYYPTAAPANVRKGAAPEDEGAGTIDLAAEYGLDTLLASYHYGIHFAAESDPDKRGVPFLGPFLPSFAAAQNVVAAQNAHIWRFGFEGIGIVPDKDTPRELLMEHGKPRRVSIPMMEAVVLPGQTVGLQHPGVSPDVDKMVAFLLGAVAQEGPNVGAFGGPGPASGHDRSLMRAHLEDAYDLVLEGLLGAWMFLGTTLNECATAVARTSGHAVPVTITTTQQQGSDTLQVRTYREMSADLCDGVYDVEAYFPNAEGENLPYAQLLAEWTLNGLIPHLTFLEKGMGDPSPERTMVQIEAEKFLFKTPEGQQTLNEMIAQELGDQKAQEAFRLQQQGRMLPDGTPAAAAQGLPPPSPGVAAVAAAPGAGAMTGTNVPNVVQSALGGIVAGGIGSGPMVADQTAVMAR